MIFVNHSGPNVVGKKDFKDFCFEHLTFFDPQPRLLQSKVRGMYILKNTEHL